MTTHHHEHRDHGLVSAFDVHQYVEAVEAHRDALKRFFAGPDGPLSPEEQRTFAGLDFFPVDPGFRIVVPALDATDDDGAPFQMQTSDDRERTARRVGRLHFTLCGVEHSLVAYKLEGSPPGSLFVPFLDATSGHETYGAGRYLDLEPEPDGALVIDFNLAYSPYCAFSPRYSCPLTPAENRLPVRIDAGERLALREEGPAE